MFKHNITDIFCNCIQIKTQFKIYRNLEKKKRKFKNLNFVTLQSKTKHFIHFENYLLKFKIKFQIFI